MYDVLWRAVVEGRLVRGTRLPSTRALAETLGVSRTTLTSTFAQLISEGYLWATVGSGTFVSTELPDEPAAPADGAQCATESGVFRLSAYGTSVTKAEPLEQPRSSGTIDFRDGRPAFDRFPYDAWRRTVARYVRAGADTFDSSSDPAGRLCWAKRLPAIWAARAPSCAMPTML